MARTKQTPTTPAAAAAVADKAEDLKSSASQALTAAKDNTVATTKDASQKALDTTESTKDALVHKAESSKAAVARTASSRKAPSVPTALHFPLVAVLSYYLSNLGYHFVNTWSEGEVAGITSRLVPTEVFALAAWKLAELAIGWYGQFDSFDLAALSLLAHSPTFYLMTAFYGVSLPTTAAYLAVDVLSTSLPVLLLRSASDAHTAPEFVPNREIITDPSTLTTASVLSAVIYCISVFVASKIYLPQAFVLYFNGIPTVEPATNASLMYVSPLATGLALLSGFAACSFIFTPTAATAPSTLAVSKPAWWNKFGAGAQTEVALSRTAVLILVTGVQTFLQLFVTMKGVEAPGAAIYASVWASAAFWTGLALALVGEA